MIKEPDRLRKKIREDAGWDGVFALRLARVGPVIISTSKKSQFLPARHLGSCWIEEHALSLPRFCALDWIMSIPSLKYVPSPIMMPAVLRPMLIPVMIAIRPVASTFPQIEPGQPVPSLSRSPVQCR
jgi:hypothetical protein